MLILSVALIAFSGMPGLLLHRRSSLGQWIALLINVTGCAVGGVALVLRFLHPGNSSAISAAWSLPVGRIAIACDDVGTVFLIPMFLISGLGAIYGLGYWKQREHIGNGRKLRLCWGILTASMVMVVLARDGVLFLMAWEIMAVTAFFLVATEENKREVRQAAWVYLVAAHVGTLCLFAFFALLRVASGSYDLWPSFAGGVDPRVTTALFVLGVVGFGLKTGIMPLHVWLPGAHANAPSHVSAILSGVLLKTGVYGLVRLAGILPRPPLWWGGTLLVAGTLSTVLGIAFAAGQRDLKRLLAYSSIENVGIIVLGIGLAALGRSRDRVDWIVLGLGGALLHVLNHGLFKPLMFMCAGGVLHAAGTRQIDLLGGLNKRMPRTFLLFLVGAIAICGLPPLNGFVSELLLYIGLLRTTNQTSPAWAWAALAAAALALAGALALGSFVKVLGTVFSGTPRSPRAERAHDPGPIMLAPMWLLAACCLAIGIVPVLFVGMFDRAIAQWASDRGVITLELENYAPIRHLSVISLALFLMIIAGGVSVRWLRRRTGARVAGTWDCGYARPTARMQYTGSSFSQMMVELLSWVLWPRRKAPHVDHVFAEPSKFSSDVPDVVLDRTLLPAFGWAEWLLSWARFIQSGPIQVYLLYVLAILLVLLLGA